MPGSIFMLRAHIETIKKARKTIVCGRTVPNGIHR